LATAITYATIRHRSSRRATEVVHVRSQLVLTLIGRDRPGLVEALAAQIAKHGGNWEESRMAHLAGKFAGILRVSLPADAASSLTTALGALEREGLRVLVESAEPPSSAIDAQRLRLELIGNDREGIVRDISQALARRKVNVDELHTSCEDAPMGGGQLFRASAILRVPGDVAVEELRTTLESLADDLMVELSLDPVTDARTR
jgi:glycine cleavage system regulatory protein